MVATRAPTASATAPAKAGGRLSLMTITGSHGGGAVTVSLA
jgi:hypothetical protein